MENLGKNLEIAGALEFAFRVGYKFGWESHRERLRTNKQAKATWK